MSELVYFFSKNLQLHVRLKLVLNFWANLRLVVLIKIFL